MAAALGVAQLAVALAYLIAVRSTPPEEFGRVAAVLAAAIVAAGLFDFGSNASAIRDLSREDISYEHFAARMQTKFVIAATAGAVTALALVVASAPPVWLTAIPVAFSLVAAQTATTPLRARTLGGVVAGVTVIDKCIALAIMAVAGAVGQASADLLWVALTAGGLASSLLAAVATRRRGIPHLSVGSRRLANPWAGSSRFGVTSAFISIQSLDLVLLALVAGPAEAGIYGAVNRWIAPMGIIAFGYSQSHAPFLARAATPAEARRTMREGAWLLAIAAAAGLFMAAAARPLVDVLLGTSYAGSAAVLSLLAVGASFSVLNQPMLVFLQARGREGVASRAVAAAVVAQLLLLLPLADARGALGAATAMLVAQLTLLITCAILVARTRT